MLNCDISFQIEERTILDKVKFSLEKGKHLLILGPSGCGKTTLLNILAGLQAPTSGTVQYNDTNLHALSSHEQDLFRGQHIGIACQTLHLINVLTVTETLLLAQHLAKKPSNQKAITDTLKTLNLSQHANVSVTTLSHGEQQRLAIARAIINEPDWLLADEPTSALDDDNCQATADLLLKQASLCNASLVIVTHDNRLKSLFENKGQVLSLGALTS